MRKVIVPVFYFSLPFFFALLSGWKLINDWLFFVPLACLAGLFTNNFSAKKRPNLSFILFVVMIISLVSATGWFFSPFFFALYLLALALGFIYTPIVSIVFTVSLIIVFSLSLTGERPAYDFLTLLSLLSVIPASIVLRQRFLLVQQAQKGILILANSKEKGITSLESILQNRITNIAVLLRQPITYIKQGLVLIASGKLSNSESQDIIMRMEKSSEEVITLIKEFERSTTDNSLIRKI